MRYFAFLALFCASFTVYTQENPGTAVALNLTNYLTDTGSGTGCSPVAGSLGTTGSGQPACAGVDNNDVWYIFTATTQAAKFTITTGNFDAVAQVLEVGTFNSVACENSNGANSGEVLRVNTLVAGNQYYLRIHSANGGAGTFTVCGQAYPDASVRVTHSPYPPIDEGVTGYRLTNNTARILYGTNNALIQASRWYFTDVDNSDVFFVQITGSNTLLQLNNVGGLCFNRTYSVLVEVQTDGYWCGTSIARDIIMEPLPVTAVSPTVFGNTYTAAGSINCNFVGTGNQFEWRFTTDNGTTQFTVLNAPNTTILQLSIVPCLRYNRIYTVEVRAQYCGVWGPWSESAFFFTANVPYVNVRPQYCNTIQTVNSYITCDFTPNVSQYAWQFAPIDPADPTMTPIGPAIVRLTPTTSMHLLLVGLTPGATYRVGAKAIFGVNDGCGQPQEGDYGNFCAITIAGGSGLTAPGYEDDGDGGLFLSHGDEQPGDLYKISTFPNPVSNGIMNVLLPPTEFDSQILINVFDLRGKLVFSEQRYSGAGTQLTQLSLPGNLHAGQYILSVQTPDEMYTTRFIVSSL